MKHIIIFDVHGRSKWQKAVEMYPDASVVFIGDYFDSFNIKAKDQLLNFQEILVFARSVDKDVQLLFGNHDIHYLDSFLRCSGFQQEMFNTFHLLLKENIDLFKACVLVQDKYLLSHAGISKVWLENIGLDYRTPIEDLVDLINELCLSNYKYMRWTPGPYRDGYGDETCQSLTWIRPPSLKRKGLLGVTQVVGHTQHPEVTYWKGNDREIWFGDAQETCNEFLLIEDGVASVVKHDD